MITTQSKSSKVSQPTVALQTTTVELMAFDLGNRYVKAGVKSNLVTYPSYQMTKPAIQDLSADKLPPNSWIIQDGNIDYLVGRVAQQFQALPSYQLNKWELARPLFYGAIAALRLREEVRIKTLRVTTPNTQDVSQVSRLKGLKGTHSFSINGKKIAITVDAVEVFDEGVPAWLRALKMGLWQFPQALNGILDLGGGTAIARLITEQGAVVRGSELILPGTFTLANKIQASLGLSQLGPLILDAIEDATYTLPTGVNFYSAFLDAQTSWLASIRAEMRSQWANYQGQYGQVLVVGGSAPLAQDLVKSSNRYLMAESPKIFALEGLING